MKTKSGHISIAEIRDQMDSGTLVANRTYQRSAGLWPQSAKSYFIDTIMTEFPFQSVYIHEYVTRSTKRIRKDIVDGQQRLTTIKAYLDDEFPLARSAKKFAGLRFSQLDDESQDDFLAYSVPVITISQAQKPEILEMFRRMNAFTVPLNDAEKRHSEFHGEFKWLVNEVADLYSPMLNSFGVLTEKQIVRMADADFITDVADVIARGIQNRQPSKLTALYRDFDDDFPRKDEFLEKLVETFGYIQNELGAIQNTFMCKSYAFHSLASALIHNRWGIPNGEEQLGSPSRGEFSANSETALANVITLAEAHEADISEGPLRPYVEACESTTHRSPQRTVRTSYILRALNDEL
jgi:hypothetical protein